jgi:hypothetical protein
MLYMKIAMKKMVKPKKLGVSVAQNKKKTYLCSRN